MTHDRKPELAADLEGVLPVLKPAGFTSHDVVAKVRRILGMKRIGHTGTLDPQVTGVLPLCLGRATRIVEYIQDLPKEYVAELTVGYSTDTEDWTGQVIERAEYVSLNREKVEQALRAFTGDIEQIPPMYSAVRVDGRRLYELARQGKEVERKARTVRIHELELLEARLTEPNPTIRFRVRCSKGTYIRTLCVDIGRALGYPSVMSELTRTATGNITLDRCLSLEDITALHRDGRLNGHLIPTDEAIRHLPELTVSADQAGHALKGKAIRLAQQDIPSEEERIRLYGPERRFIGIFRLEPKERLLRPEKVFV